MKRSSRFALIGLCAAFILCGDETERLTPKVQIAKTEHADFPANDTLRMQNSVGELTIEGWDQPNIEITTIKSTRTPGAARDHDKAVQGLDRVQITMNRAGNELVITTKMPRHRAFPYAWPLSVVMDFDLEYRIKVPRSAGIVVKHSDGEVHIDDVAGNMDVTARQGLIELHLPDDSPRSIDAKADYGSVNSDFPGRESARLLHLGHELIEAASTASQSLRLRIGYGDIVLLKARHPQAPAPMTAPH